MEILTLVGRTGLLWMTALVVFRFMGKRTLGKMGPFDFAVVIMIGEAVAIGMENTKEPLINAVAITAALGVLQWLLTWLNIRFHWLENITQGRPSTVITNGKVNKQSLRTERMSRADLMMELRQNQVKLGDLKKARLEPSGKVSISKKSSSSSGNSNSKSSQSRPDKDGKEG